MDILTLMVGFVGGLVLDICFPGTTRKIFDYVVELFKKK